MLFQLIIGPFSTLHLLPKGMSLLLLGLTAVISSLSLGIAGVQVPILSILLNSDISATWTWSLGVATIACSCIS